MSLTSRIKALEEATQPPIDDPWDPVALAVRRRREAEDLRIWEEKIKEIGRQMGRDPDEYLEATRRRHQEKEYGPATTMVLRMGRLHPLKPGETVEPGTKTFLMYL